jgi:hypothetical protein
VTELADIFRRYGPAYRAKFGERLLPSHRQAMRDIEQCRTEALGGHIYHCDQCDESCYSYHSCRNRHCPKCQHHTTEQWLARQQAFLLPVPHFMVTFTLPKEFRAIARRNQKFMYDLLFRTSAAALQELAADPRFVGGQIGMLGVLQTWARDLTYHPHVHYLVPGGGVTTDGPHWRPSRHNFLVRVEPLGRLFRGKFRAALAKTDLFEQVPAQVWAKDWVVHCEPVGNGEATLKYLAPYIFRVALSNKRIVKLADDQVTFGYHDNKGKQRYRTLPAEKFIHRFLQHVLPHGFKKVRYYGLFSPAKRELLNRVRLVLIIQAAPQPAPATETAPQTEPPQPPGSVPCPQCGRPMRRLAKLRPPWCRPP